MQLNKKVTLVELKLSSSFVVLPLGSKMSCGLFFIRRSVAKSIVLGF